MHEIFDSEKYREAAQKAYEFIKRMLDPSAWEVQPYYGEYYPQDYAYKLMWGGAENIPDDAETICNNTELIGITEMSVNVHLLDGRIGGSMGRHGAVGGFVRVKGIIQPICFFEGFELFDDTVGIFGIVFRHPGLNAGGVKKKHGRFLFINTLADRFGQFHKVIKHRL